MVSNLKNLKSIVEKTIALLKAADLEEQEDKYKIFLKEQIQKLQKSLDESSATPENYKVAVVGSFKVGKSSFVNALCNEGNLASVDTNPETAAITVFKYSKDAFAEIHMISQDDWNEMVELYGVNPSDQRCARYKKLKEFEKSRSLKIKQSKKNEVTKSFRISELEKQYISSSRVIEKIPCDNWNDKKQKKAFAKTIQKYMSRRDPRHYLVEKINFYSPVSLLDSGIEFVDTPGLDDTDRYRVDLTMKFVKDVDVILYLTHSGRSYSQSDKNFIIEQLRRKTIKHLRLVVTKIDSTYKQAIKDAQRQEEDIPTFEQHLKLEEDRLREQLDITLNEILDERDVSEDDKEYFLEQLCEIPIDFISSEYYWEKEHDKAGIGKLTENLKIMLDKSERMLQAQNLLKNSLKSVLDRTQRTYASRLEIISQDFDAEKLQNQLKVINGNLKNVLDEFEQFLRNQLKLFREQNEADVDLIKILIDNILNKTQLVIIDEFEKIDLAKHWKTRRCGYWGSLAEIEIKIASKIFPHVEIVLKRFIDRFDKISNQIKKELERLQQNVIHIEEKSYTSSGVNNEGKQLNIVNVFENQYLKLNADINTFVIIQKDSIVRHLDTFISDEVKDKIDFAREKVSSIWGRGTTKGQNEQVDKFYGFLKKTLMDELNLYLDSSFKTFSEMLEKKTELIHPELQDEINIIIQDRLSAIEHTLVEMNEKQKEKLSKYLGKYNQKLINVVKKKK